MKLVPNPGPQHNIGLKSNLTVLQFKLKYLIGAIVGVELLKSFLKLDAGFEKVSWDIVVKIKLEEALWIFETRLDVTKVVLPPLQTEKIVLENWRGHEKHSPQNKV